MCGFFFKSIYLKNFKCLKIAVFFLLESTAHQGIACVYRECKVFFLIILKLSYWGFVWVCSGRGGCLFVFVFFFPKPVSHDLLLTYFWKSKWIKK